MKDKIKLIILPVIVIIGLLVIQALCDLELPEYTSAIINNGIQNQGIEYSVPKVMPKSMYEAMLSISNENRTILASYDLVVGKNLNKRDYDKLSKEYPIIEKEDIYLLRDLNDEELSVLEGEIIKPFLVTTTLYFNSELANNYNITLDNETLLDYLMKQDKEVRNSLLNNINSNFDNISEDMLRLYGIQNVAKVYDLVGIDMEDNQVSYIFNKGSVMLLIALVGMVVAICVGYLISKLASYISYSLRKKVVTKIAFFSNQEFKEFGASSLITRSTNDVEQIKNFCVMLLRIVVFAPIMGIGAFIKVFDNPLNWLIAVALIVIVALISFLFSLAMPKFKMIQKLIDKMNLVSREIITGMSVVRTFNTEDYEVERFDEANKKLTNNNLFVNRVMSFMMPSMMLVMNITSILIVWFGAKVIDLGTIQVGTLLAFITYTMQIIMSFLMISMVSVMLPRALISIKRVKEILKKENSIKESEKIKRFKKEDEGVVEFQNVSFKYPDADEAMLKDISFKALPGTTTAFIGSTGSGKSTLINLIPRFFDVTEGKILVEGVDVREASLKSLRDIIGYVPQKGILFSGSIRDNLALGVDSLTKDKEKEVAKVSQALDFIEERNEGFESFIAQGGANVSGGQKQRLSIARALAKDAHIYIFDDSFSALDFKTDASLRKALRKYSKNATVLIVAQRISTIMNADNIIVLDEGRIVGAGTHKELLKNCKIYKEIALSQLKEEEL